MSNPRLERSYATLVYAQTNSYLVTAQRLNRNWRTVKSKIDLELLQHLKKYGADQTKDGK